MDDAGAAARGVLVTLYRENSAQARHYEQQRQHVTAVVAVVAAIVLSMTAFQGSRDVARVRAGFLIVVGAFGFLASLRHHERARLHVARVHAIRRELSARFPVDIGRIYETARQEHARRYPRLSERTARTHYVWQALHAAVIAAGVALLWLA
jgi:hypothetical protein